MMNSETQNQQQPEVISQPKAESVWPGNVAARAAKLSIAAGLVSFGLNAASVTIFQHRAIFRAGAATWAMMLVWAGVILGIISLVKSRKDWAKGVVPLAMAGVLLNGSMLAMTFIDGNMLGRLFGGGLKLTAQELENMPNVFPGSMVVIEPKFGFRVELPGGIVNYPKGRNGRRTIRSYARYGPGGELDVMIRIDRLWMTLPMNYQPPHEETVKQAIPSANYVRVGREKWNSHILSVFVIGKENSKGEFLTWDVRVPLEQEAIEIYVTVPKWNEAQSVDILKRMLESLKGNSNWD